MDYIREFIKANDISINEDYFAIGGCKVYDKSKKMFFIDGNYRLRDIYTDIDHTSIFVKLLSGRYSIIL